MPQGARHPDGEGIRDRAYPEESVAFASRSCATSLRSLSIKARGNSAASTGLA